MSEHFVGPIRRRSRVIATASLVVLLALGASSAVAASAPWSNPVPVGEGDVGATVVAPNGTITATLEQETGIYTVTSTDAGATWGTPVAVGSIGDYSAFRSAIAVTSSGLLAVSWVEIAPGFVKTIYVATSADQGSSWTTKTQLLTVDNDSDDPVVASSNANGFTIVWKEGFAKMASSTTDGGATWSDPAVITEFLNSYNAASLAPIGINELVVIFQEFDGDLGQYSIQSRSSTDGGVTWGTKVAVAPSWSGTLGTGIYSIVVSPASGSVVAVWSRPIGNDQESLFAATSTDGGATWGATIDVSGPVDSLRYFRVQAVSPTTAGIVWHHYLDATQILAYSTVVLGASAASTPVVIDTIDLNFAAPYDRLPSLTTLGDIRVVTWLQSNRSADAGYRVSASCDGGATWTPAAELALGTNVSRRDAQAVVSGGVFTALWGISDRALERNFSFSSSAAVPCTRLAGAALAQTGTNDTTVAAALLLALVTLGLGAGILVKRTRQS